MQRRRLEAGGGWQGGHGLRPEQAFERALGMGHGLSPLFEGWIGVADELAVAHAEAGLEQRVDLASSAAPLRGLWRSLARAPHRPPGPRPTALFSCPIPLPPPVVRSPVIGYDLSVSAYGEQGQSLAITVVLWRSMARNGEKIAGLTEIAIDGRSLPEMDKDGRRSSEMAKVFDGKMCDVGPHHRLRPSGLRLSYSPSARRER